MLKKPLRKEITTLQQKNKARQENRVAQCNKKVTFSYVITFGLQVITFYC